MFRIKWKQTADPRTGCSVEINDSMEAYMLVTAKEMLEKARDGKYAVGHFNINNLEWTSDPADSRGTEIPGLSWCFRGRRKIHDRLKTVVGMVNGMLEEMKITVPVALHCDHGTYEGCLKCIDAGFSHHVRRFSLPDRRER